MSERVREKTKRMNEHALTSFTCFVCSLRVFSSFTREIVRNLRIH